MIDTEKFKIKRQELKKTVKEANFGGLEMEIYTYNFIVCTCEKNNVRVQMGLDAIFSEILNNDGGDISKKVEDAKTEALYWKMMHKHDPAFIIVLGFNSDSNFDYMHHVGKITKDIGVAGNDYFDESVLKKLRKVGYEDGAILIDSNRKVFATHAHLINLNPELVRAHYPLSIKDNYDEHSAKFFGFKQDVNTRHFSALYASFHLPGAVIYTLGERIEKSKNDGSIDIEDGHIRRYERGLITFSTMDAESETAKEGLIYLLKEKKGQARREI